MSYLDSLNAPPSPIVRISAAEWEAAQDAMPGGIKNFTRVLTRELAAPPWHIRERGLKFTIRDKTYVVIHGNLDNGWCVALDVESGDESLLLVE